MSQKETLIMIFGLVNWTVNTNEDQLSSADSSVIQLLRKIKNIKGGEIILAQKLFLNLQADCHPGGNFPGRLTFFPDDWSL